MKILLLRSLLSVFAGLITTAVNAQVAPTNSGNTGNLLSHPSGTRIYQGGAIVTPTGTVVNPSVTMPGANGSNTYYYPDGSLITTNGRTINSSGSFLVPNSPNGGLGNPTIKPVQPFSTPNRLNQGLK
ncbi:hypothetical protein [Stenomitos frigidus]|uniref:Filamentous hemagglutinin n=1 Tax=Stenomitos frigidus ULC18 TaxID=2107698 RepID=A0A2T1DYZ3_9CYAN|nr:hypothetical protein [Stenomitos frigidus]PSB25715.1 hypothetical protein C7B82_21855 [Stenomitos frigidus ULC18]